MSFLQDFWFIQVLGAIGLIFVFLAWNAKARKNILFLQSVNLVFFIIHYGLLSAWTGALGCIIVLIRNLVFTKKDEAAWANNPAWIAIFTVLSGAVLAFSWAGWISLFPIAGVAIGTLGVWKDKPRDIRFYMLFSCIAWIPYTIVVHSYTGLLSQLIGTAGILVGMYRHDRKIETL